MPRERSHARLPSSSIDQETTILPTIPSWNLQTYLKVPTLLNLRLKDRQTRASDPTGLNGKLICQTHPPAMTADILVIA